MCTVHFTPSWLERRSDRFNIGVDMLFTCDAITDNACYMFTPVLAGEDCHIELPSVLVAGKGRYRAMRWALWGSTRRILRHYRIKKILRGVDSRLYYPYKVQVNYEPWMDGARIILSGSDAWEDYITGFTDIMCR